MKTIYTLLIAFLISISSFAQNGINYKAVVKDDMGNVIIMQSVDVQFIIYEGSALTNNVYQESHTVMTDNNGIIVLNIGQGTTGDIFTDVAWGNDEHWLNVQVDTGAGLVDLGTTQFMTVPYALDAANVSGLEAIDEGNGIGWRLLGSVPNNYGTIGLHAQDMSFSSSPSSFHGATGNYSHATGYDTKALWNYSTAMGFTTIAQGSSSTAMGSYTTASGISSTAMGANTTASGPNSIAFGFVTTASSDASTAMGTGTMASGVRSTAMGLNTRAQGTSTLSTGTGTIASGENSIAMGSYNVDDLNGLLMIGNGIDINNRNNALSLFKNGSFLVGSAVLNNNLASTTDDTRFFFNKPRGAFRAGFANGSQWDDVNIGDYSTAFGFVTTASGARSTALGSGTKASGFASTAIGNYNKEDTAAYLIVGNGTGDNDRKNALVLKSNGDFILGSSQLDDDNTTPNDNARVFFNKAKGAFRAGLVDDTYWDDSEVGSYSVSMGLNTKAKGQNSFAMGGNATATGFNAISIGNNTTATNVSSVALGAGTTANGRYSTAMNILTTSDALASTAIGQKNVGGGNPNAWVWTDPLFEIGNSEDSNNKTNALTVLKNGTITAPSLTNSLINTAGDKALVTKEYVDANSSSGLEQIFEGGFGGWRLIGRDPSQYNDIGAQAIDFSAVNIISPLDLPNYGGATFQYATAFGVNTKAAGLASFSGGRGTLAESSYSVALGLFNTGGGDPFSAIASDPLFEVGNGSSNILRKNAFTILKNGKTGINTSNPASLFEVAHLNSSPVNGTPQAQSLSILNKNTNNSWQFHTTDYLNLYRNGVFKGSWNSTSGAYVQASDRRVKKDITPLETGTLNKVMQLNPVSYLMKDQTDTNRNLGLISQEVQEIFPSITHYVEESDLLTLSYTELIPILIKALQEQQAIIDSQTLENNKQNANIELLQQRMTALEASNN